MKLIGLLISLAALIPLSGVDSSPGGQAHERPPNIILLLTDDQGYADVDIYDARGRTTPHLHRMAREGRRFTRFYAAQAV